jgi:hypothetical protein
MRFRLKAFGLHLLGSAAVLSIVLGGLFFGWYRWPGWYLTGVMTVSALLAGVDVTLGPLLTLLIANASKPRRELARDISFIVAAQLVALGYGAATLWQGRPLYYTFSEDRLEVVRAFELVPAPASGARPGHAELAPHWWSLPRWVWAPMPDDAAAASQIMQSAIRGGADLIDMPWYFRPWADGLPELRKTLKPVEALRSMSVEQKKHAKARLAELGYAPDAPISMVMMGRIAPLVAVFDPETGRMRALLYTE